MPNCSVAQYLSKALLELHSSGPHTDFPTRLFASLRLCFTCDFYSFNEWTDKKVERVEIYPNWDVSSKLFKDYYGASPRNARKISAKYEVRSTKCEVTADRRHMRCFIFVLKGLRP